MKRILGFIGEVLLLFIMTIIFLFIVSVLTFGVILLLVYIGELTGIGLKIFIYAIWFVVFWKAWDFLAWVVGKIADREERKKEREYFNRE